MLQHLIRLSCLALERNEIVVSLWVCSMPAHVCTNSFPIFRLLLLPIWHSGCMKTKRLEFESFSSYDLNCFSESSVILGVLNSLGTDVLFVVHQLLGGEGTRSNNLTGF